MQLIVMTTIKGSHPYGIHNINNSKCLLSLIEVVNESNIYGTKVHLNINTIYQKLVQAIVEIYHKKDINVNTDHTQFAE